MSRDFLELKTANDYINRKRLSKDEMEIIKNLVYDFKNNFAGFFSLVIYRQISRLARMLDKIEEIETNLYELQLTDYTNIEGVERLQKMLNMNVTLIFDQLTNIAGNPNLKPFFDNNAIFVEKITQKIFQDPSSNQQVELSSSSNLSKENRVKINNVLTNLLQLHS